MNLSYIYLRDFAFTFNYIAFNVAIKYIAY